ncbi:MAG: FecR domain-containing protein [Candidatus Omnitrophica bacterium]|nr:FecR domain-containing protein [Candidatus Omnitrophota bacterium]
MRKFLISLVIIIFGIALFHNPPAPNAQEEARTRGEIIEIEGKAEVRPAGTDAWKPAEAGIEIRSGDYIRAGEGSYADLIIERLEERNAIVRISESSVIEPQMSRSEVIINVIAGKVVFWVEKIEGKLDKFEIRTPNSIIGIEGSHGIVDYDKGSNATDAYLEVSGGYVVNIDSGKLEQLYRGPNYFQVQKKDIEMKKKRKKIYSWDLEGFFGSHAFVNRGPGKKRRELPRYSKIYFSGKYATIIDCINGEVAVGPYNEIGGPNYHYGITLYTGQRVRIEDTIYVRLGAAPEEPAPPVKKDDDEEKREEEQEKKKDKEEVKESDVPQEEEKEEEGLELKEKIEESQKDIP